MPEAANPASKGPLVYLDYDQEALDRAYDQAQYAPNMAQILRRYAKASDDLRARLGPPQRVKYGPSDIEGIDLYRTQKPNAPIIVYLHGGAWRQRSAKDYGFVSEMLSRAGVHFLAVDFAGVEATDGRLQPMVQQVRSATAWAYKNAETFGGDRNRLYMFGHSSGAHLTSTVLLTDWSQFGLPADPIKGALCASGMYDLYPVSLSARSNYVQFDPQMIDELSAIRHLDRIRMPVLVAHGTCETPEFQRQARDFAAAAEKAGRNVRLLVAEEYNHFEIYETLTNPFGVLGRAMLDLIGLQYG